MMSARPIIDLPHPIAVVCHDAGAANHIIAWLNKENMASRVQPFMAGPALTIWQATFPDIPPAASLTEAMAGAQSLLSGTGWASDIEHDARCMAQQAGIQTVAMVDHWVNYAPRFMRHQHPLLPDEMWVVDREAFDLAQQHFPNTVIRCKEDVYTQQTISSLLPIAHVLQNKLLYVLEPMRDTWGNSTQGEFQALEYFFGHLALLELPANTLIVLRPHPSDAPHKYAAYLSHDTPYRIALDTGSLLDSISSAKWVAGCASFALTLALKGGRTVFCTLPPWAPECPLPHKGLIHLKMLVAASEAKRGNDTAPAT